MYRLLSWESPVVHVTTTCDRGVLILSWSMLEILYFERVEILKP